MKYTDQAAQFARIAQTERSFGRYARDIIALGDSLKNEAVSANPMSVLGIHHAVDEVKALMAMRVAQDEIELEMKSAILLGHEPMIGANANLQAMLEAALLADAQRVKPGALPLELRKKFRI